jgi:hypothetical protein
MLRLKSLRCRVWTHDQNQNLRLAKTTVAHRFAHLAYRLSHEKKKKRAAGTVLLSHSFYASSGKKKIILVNTNINRLTKYLIVGIAAAEETVSRDVARMSHIKTASGRIAIGPVVHLHSL